MFEHKKCFYPGCESKAIIKAHSIQENRHLNYLADQVKGQNEVYYLDDNIVFDRDANGAISKQRTQRILHHRGIKAASTFGGFCQEHDKIFKPTIEDVEFKGDLEQLFFYTYRCYAYYLHKKYESYVGLKSAVNEARNEIKGTTEIPDFSNLKSHGKIGLELNNILKGLENTLKGVDGLFNVFIEKSETELFGLKLKKDRFDEVVEKKKYSEFRYAIHSFDGVIPVAASSVVHYIDEFHQPSSDNVVYPAEIAITVFPSPEKNQTHIILGGFEDNPNFGLVFHKFNALSNSKREKFVSDLLIHRGSNIFISPRMYNKFSDSNRSELIDQRASSSQYVVGLPEIKLNLFELIYADKSD